MKLFARSPAAPARCALVLCLGSSAAAFAQESLPHSAVKAPASVVVQAHGMHAASVLAGLSDDLQTLSHAVEPAVVKIYATGLAPVSGKSNNTAYLAQQQSLGAGSIMDSNGYILTNAHVIGNARSVSVLLPDVSRTFEPSDDRNNEPPTTAVSARVIGMDSVSDLAVIKVEKTGLPALKFGDSDRTHPGELVLAFGSPLGLQDSVSLGVISAVNRQLDPNSPMVYLQTDAAINPGNSGGPLVDMQGDLVGVNSMIETKSGGNEGLGFSIPSNTAKGVYEQIIRFGHARRGVIGISPMNLNLTLAQGLGLSRDSGVLVEDVEPDSPAAEAGLKPGEVLTTLNGKPLRDIRQIAVQMFRETPGEVIHLGVLDGEAAKMVDITVSESRKQAASLFDPAKADQYVIPRLGVLAVAIDAEVARSLESQRESDGLVVIAKTLDASAEPIGLDVGDILYYANRTKLNSVEALKSFMLNLKRGDPVVLQVERDSQLNFISFRFED
ncbi:MAG: trypsin-like peptidase domain-containing protein [Janthinobacterium lividum]